ncbi:MAG: sensor histidine kinase [Pseudonocardia sp.]|nr:sensor histidine kinase [Pseudonocardia sp.]
MPATVEPDSPGDQRTVRTLSAALFWRQFLLSALVFIAGAGVLAFSPATVSTPILARELIVLAIGLAVLLTANAVLLRSSLRPLDGLSALMKRVDLLQPGERHAVRGGGNAAYLVRTFNDMLDRLENERGASSARALAAQEGERQRIAQELHDEIGQSLTAVLLELKRTVDRAPDDLRDELRTVQETIRDSLDEVRQVARRLRPGVLEDLGLLSAIGALISDLTAASQIPVRQRLDPDLPVLGRDAELVLYRIAQESMTNITRHADAGWVEVVLTGDRERVVLRITDDGRGLGGAAAEGAGIRGMRERALLIGAQLTIGPAPTGGTEVRLAVPIEAGRG